MNWQMLVILAAAVAGAGFYAGVETGAYCLSRLRLNVLVSRSDRRAQRVNRLLGDPAGVIAMTLVGHNLCVFASTAIMTRALSRAHHAELIATLILAPILFVFAENLPKHLFAGSADTLLYRLILPVTLSKIILYPPVLILKGLSRFWQAILGGNPEDAQDFLMTPAQLTFLLDERQKGGRLSEYQKMLSINIMRLTQLPVERAMIPMDEVVAFECSTSVPDLLEAAREHPYTRYPVFRETRADIAGIVNVVDLGLASREDEELATFLRDAVSVPSTCSVLDALHSMRGEYALMAIVTQEGVPAGIVTVKDLIEEIAGELAAW